MKKTLLISALFIFACSSEDSSEDSPLPTYTIEGKWLIEGTVSARKSQIRTRAKGKIRTASSY